MKFGHSGFQSQILWRFIFPVWVSWCDSLFPFPDCTCVCLFPADSPTGLFNSPLGLCPSYTQCCLFFTFTCGVCSASLQVVFWVIYTYVIQLYLWDEGCILGSFYFTIFPVELVLFIVESVSLKSPTIIVCTYSPFLSFFLYIFSYSVIGYMYVYILKLSS